MALQYGRMNKLPKAWKLSFGHLALVGCAVLVSSSVLPQAAFAHEEVISSGDRYRPNGLISETYQLGGGDKVHVIVFNELQLTGDFVVDSAGNLSLPLIGETPVLGKTVGEAADAIEAAYLKDNFLRTPKVTLEITTYRPFFITGEVRLPGQYPYSAGLTVWSAFATSQGLTPRARKKVVYIRRFGDTTEKAYALTPELRVMPGDTIRVAERLF